MAAIDSRQRGVMQPLSEESTGDCMPDLRKWMAAVTGLPLEKVRRRWTPKPGTRPAVSDDWVAVGAESIETHGTPDQLDRKGAIGKPESGDVIRISHQTLHCVASFYGPNAPFKADLFRESAQVFQNAGALGSELKLQAMDAMAQHVPDLLNEQWVDRYDVRFSLGRAVRRVFGVRDIAAPGEIIIKTDTHIEG